MRLRCIKTVSLLFLILLFSPCLYACSSVSQVGDVVRQGDEAYTAGNFEMAIQYYTQAIDTEKLGSAIYNNRGMAYLKLERYPEAETDFIHATQEDPKTHLYWNNLGLTQFYLGKIPEAKESFSKAIALNNKESSYYINHADMAMTLGSYEEAVEDYTQALNLDRTIHLAYHNRAACYFNLEQYDKALEDYNTGIEMDPSNYILFWNRAETYRMMEMYEEALEDYQIYGTLESGLTPDFYLKRAEVYQYLGKTEDALADYNNAIRVGDSDPETRYSRGNLYYELQDYKNAIDNYVYFLKQGNPDKETELIVSGNLAVCYLSSDRLEEALEAINHCMSLKADYAWAYYTRGQIYQQMEMFEEAKADYDYANRLLGYGESDEGSDSFPEISSDSSGS